MAYEITDSCNNCGMCEPECPVEAIREEDGKRIINPYACTDCGTCAEACPVGAVVPGDAHR